MLELDTKLPRIDLEKIETHLRQAREEERKVPNLRSYAYFRQIVYNEVLCSIAPTGTRYGEGLHLRETGAVVVVGMISL